MGAEKGKVNDFINKQLRWERQSKTKFTDLNDVMREYHEVVGHTHMENGIQNLVCMHFNSLFCKNHHDILRVIVNHQC